MMKKNKKIEFSKKLIMMDYLILIVLFLCQIIFPAVDFVTVTVAWIAQLGISSAAYYWKAKNENRLKVPLKVVESLPKEIRDQLDLTQIVVSIVQAD